MTIITSRPERKTVRTEVVVPIAPVAVQDAKEPKRLGIDICFSCGRRRLENGETFSSGSFELSLRCLVKQGFSRVDFKNTPCEICAEQVEGQGKRAGFIVICRKCFRLVGGGDEIMGFAVDHILVPDLVSWYDGAVYCSLAVMTTVSCEQCRVR